ncbi:UNVERIFIED_CONTAM: hypothetical protein FKN15_012434 [Acipenser sinensis]
MMEVKQNQGFCHTPSTSSSSAPVHYQMAADFIRKYASLKCTAPSTNFDMPGGVSIRICFKLIYTV